MSTPSLPGAARSAVGRLVVLLALLAAGLALPFAAPASAAPSATTHSVPGGATQDYSGVHTVCNTDRGFSCTAAGYTGTRDQYGKLGWTSDQYWSWGTSWGDGTYRHNCTTYAAYRLMQNGYSFPGWTGDASGWARSAPAGIVDQTPAVGAIAQWNRGHVAYVEAVTSSYVEISSDSLGTSSLPGGFTYRVQIALNSSYLPDNYLHFRDQALPAQPASPQVVATTSSAATLTWTDTSSNEDSFVSQYVVRGTTAWKPGPGVPAGSQQMQITGLAQGTSYAFQVGARNAQGTKWSAYAYGTTASLPAQPGSPRVAGISPTSATLSWTDGSWNEQQFVSQYRVGDSGGWKPGPAVGAGATTMTIGGLSPATPYTFQVGARNTAGTHWSDYAKGTTPQSLPAQPGSPSVRSTTATSAVLGWVDASSNESTFITQYRIGSGSWVGGPTVAAGSQSATFTGLRSGTTYTFQVGARNSVGTHWSAFATGTTVSLPAQPGSPHVTSTGTTTAALAWSDASNNEDGFISQYRVGDSGSWTAGPAVGAGAQSMTVGGLSPNTTYTFQVGARNAAGTHWSAYFAGHTQTPPSLPAEPGSPRVTSTTTSSAVLAWNDASNNEDGFISQYRVGDSGGWVAGPQVGAGATSMTIGGLAANTRYTFQVGARNAAGTHWSAYATGTTAANPAPTGYHAGRQVSIDSHATGGVSGHEGPGDSYSAGPTRPASSSLWIVCYVTGQSINGPYGTSSIWDLSDDGLYYTDAWLWTGSNNPVVPPCSLKSVKIDSHATGGVSGHKGPGDAYAAGPTHAANSAITIACYVDGQSISGPYGTSTIWDLADDGLYYTDAWLWTGSNNPVVPHC